MILVDMNVREQNFYNAVHNLLNWNMAMYNNPSHDIEISTIESLVNETVDSKFICNFETDNPHLKTCMITINCGHSQCLRCAMKMIYDFKNLVCINHECPTTTEKKSYEVTGTLNIANLYSGQEIDLFVRNLVDLSRKLNDFNSQSNKK